MPTLLILLIVGGAGFFFFTAARAAAERATEVGHDACQAAGVQWLDQSVHAIGMRLRRKDDGWLGLERSFRFEYSEAVSYTHLDVYKRQVLELGELGFCGSADEVNRTPVQYENGRSDPAVFLRCHFSRCHLIDGESVG